MSNQTMERAGLEWTLTGAGLYDADNWETGRGESWDARVGVGVTLTVEGDGDLWMAHFTAPGRTFLSVERIWKSRNEAMAYCAELALLLAIALTATAEGENAP